MLKSFMSSMGLRKGAWTEEEDHLLKKCILNFGEGRWHQVPLRAGLDRCRKSCRMRWLNYLKPNIKRGEFKEDEVDLIVKLHKLLGNRWSMIAGRIPGRTANDIKNYWNTNLKKEKQHRHYCRSKKKNIPIKNNVGGVVIRAKDPTDSNNVNSIKTVVFRPRPRTFSKAYSWTWNINDHCPSSKVENNRVSSNMESININVGGVSSSDEWWESLLFDKEDGENDRYVDNVSWENLLANKEDYDFQSLIM